MVSTHIKAARLVPLALVSTLCAMDTVSAQDTTVRLFERVNGSVCTIYAEASDGTAVSRGSGFVLEGSGELVTNAHVLAGLETATVKCGEQTAGIRKVTRYDRDVDLVVAETGDLNVEGLKLSTRTDIEPGTPVYVFSSPYGLEGTIAPGLASGLRTIRGRSYIQISAPISAGSSGGPVTDDRGEVIGVAVAALEVAQNINFAIPASVIGELPTADMRLADLAPREPRSLPAGPAQTPEEDAEHLIASGGEEFRGHAFGSPCGEIAIAEYQRKRPTAGTKGSIRFRKWYSGTLELDVELYGVPATLFYECNERYGMVEGSYRIKGHKDAVADIANALSAEYGAGVLTLISEDEAASEGCRWNYSLPGSRFYRPSERTSWNVNDRFRVDMLECGGKSDATFVFYGDPVLIKAAGPNEGPTRVSRVD